MNSLFEAVELLIDHSQNVNSEINNESLTLLHTAANNGDGHMARFLLEQGARINVDFLSGKMPIHNAVAAGSAPVVKLLIWYGADVNCMTRT